MVAVEVAESRPIRGAILWSMIGGGTAFALLALPAQETTAMVLGAAVSLLMAPALGWCFYFVFFRFFFGMIRIIPLLGPRLYTAIDLLLHGKNVAELNAKDDALHQEKFEAEHRRELLLREYWRDGNPERCDELLREISHQKKKALAAEALQQAPLRVLGEFDPEQVLAGDVHEQAARAVEEMATHKGDKA